MNITIDGRTCTVQPNQLILEAARQNGIDIPTLCHHEALAGQACCRLCVVEVEDDKGRRSVVVSCTHPVHDGMIVHTASPKVMGLRRTVLALLHQRAPAAEGKLPEYCREYGVGDYGLRFNVDSNEKCILCGLCTKACDTLGNSAIATALRGVDKVVAPPFNDPPEDCIGCASCARVCPTSAIDCTDTRDTRTIWHKTFTLVKCAKCGKPYATKEELAWLKDKLLDTPLNLDLCPTCRVKSLATGFE